MELIDDHYECRVTDFENFIAWAKSIHLRNHLTLATKLKNAAILEGCECFIQIEHNSRGDENYYYALRFETETEAVAFKLKWS